MNSSTIFQVFPVFHLSAYIPRDISISRFRNKKLDMQEEKKIVANATVLILWLEASLL
jgi:hypothetical protein